MIVLGLALLLLAAPAIVAPTVQAVASPNYTGADGLLATSAWPVVGRTYTHRGVARAP